MITDKVSHVQAQGSALEARGALMRTKAQSVIIRVIRGFPHFPTKTLEKIN